VLPRTEVAILKDLAVLAVHMAVDGLPGEGYTTLVEGLGRVQSLRDAGAPCGEELVVQYRRILDEYAARYDVARE
jgi:hypothetical protein